MYSVPTNQVFSLTDLVFENPQGDSGDLDLDQDISGHCTTLFVEGLANFRDLDFHWVTPLTFPANSSMVLVLIGCDLTVPNPGTTCNDGMAYTGVVKPSS